MKHSGWGKLVGALVMGIGLSGCGNSLNCMIAGDNIEGHIIYTSAVAARAGKNVVVQYSTNSFTGVAGSKTINNAQGFVQFPYSYCAPSGTNVQFRAFQDDNGDGAYQSGEGNGRHDGDSSSTHQSYITKNQPTPNASAVPPVEWTVINGVDIHLDNTVSQ